MKSISIALFVLGSWVLVGEPTWGSEGVVQLRSVSAAQTACPDQPLDTFVALRRRGNGYEFRFPTSTYVRLPRGGVNGDGSYPFVRTVPAPDGWTPEQVGLSSSPKDRVNEAQTA
jgi:hypothetical protein